MRRMIKIPSTAPDKYITVKDFVDSITEVMSLSPTRFASTGERLEVNEKPVLDLRIYANHTQSSGVFRVSFTKDGQYTEYIETDISKRTKEGNIKKVSNIDLSKINLIKYVDTSFEYTIAHGCDPDGTAQSLFVVVTKVIVNVTLYGIRRKSDCTLAKLKTNAEYV